MLFLLFLFTEVGDSARKILTVNLPGFQDKPEHQEEWEITHKQSYLTPQ